MAAIVTRSHPVRQDAGAGNRVQRVAGCTRVTRRHWSRVRDGRRRLAGQSSGGASPAFHRFVL
jgi:hypothetical protein